MPTQLVFLSPSAFVDSLVNPGLRTSAGPVALAQYVSTAHRSPLAHQVFALLEGVADGRIEAPATVADGARQLRRLREDVINAGDRHRPSNWRRVFTGQGLPENLQRVWNFILAQRSLLQALPALDGGHGRSVSFEQWFAAGNPLPGMVRDEVFGYDCLGYIGNYLRRAGLRPDYPEMGVAGYARRLGLVPVEQLADVQALTLLLWPGSAGPGTGGAQHIAIVDRVLPEADASLDSPHDGPHNTSDSGPRLLVDLCQSSSGGPQTNRRVALVPSARGAVHLEGQALPAFTMAEAGSPAAPVRGRFAMMRHPHWRLVVPRS